MTHHHSLLRHRAARLGVATGFMVSAVAVALSAAAVVSPGEAGAVAVSAGAAQVVTPTGSPGAGVPLASGGSATSFTLKLPTGAACAADGNNGGRWHTYMVPASEDEAAVAFNGNGSLVGASIGSGGTGTFRNSLYSLAGTPVRGQAPNLGDAAIINIPNLRFTVWSTGNVPPGTYDVGIACVDLDLASERDSYWNTQLTFVADGEDPLGVTWTSPTSSTTTTAPSTTTTTVGGSTTTTTAPSTTTTTVDGSTTTDPSTTTSTVADPSTTDTTIDVLGGGLGGSGTGGGGLPVTGTSVLRLAVSSGLLLVFGRMAVLVARPTRVVWTDQ